MSSSELRKIPTDWLDHNDRTAAEAIAAEASNRQLSADSNPTNDWEVIGISSGEVSPPLPRDYSQDGRNMSATENGQNEQTAASVTEDDRQGGLVVQLCGISRRVFAPVSYCELGTGRLFGTHILLVIRLLILFTNGISAGFSYALREKVPVKFLLSELFLWLHLSFLFLLPLLLLSSVLTMRWNFLRERQGEGEPSKKGQGLWLTVEILYQVVMVLSQSELVRLVVMHSVPSLRPIIDHGGAELLFSLRNPFAAQRYVMVASTIVDSLLSTVPLRGENCIPALLLFIPWTSASLFSHQTTSSTGAKVGYLVGSSVLVVVLSLLNVLIHRALRSCAQPRKEQRDDTGKVRVVDIV